MVVVLACPEGLYSPGATFSWTDFNASLKEGIWVDGMRVQFTNVVYEIRNGKIHPIQDVTKFV